MKRLSGYRPPKVESVKRSKFDEENKKKDDNIIILSIFPQEILIHISKQIVYVKEAYRMSSVCKSLHRIMTERVSELASNMDWSMYVTQKYMTTTITAVLGNFDNIDKSSYINKYEGKGGITAYMIYECLRGNDVYASFPGGINVSPSLDKNVNGTRTNNVKLVSYTPLNIRSSLDLIINSEELSSVDSRYDDSLDEENYGYDETDYGYIMSDNDEY